jgi:hypothetical protein
MRHDLVNYLFGVHATVGPRLTGYTITTETGRVLVLKNELQSVMGTAEDQAAAAALAREQWLLRASLTLRALFTEKGRRLIVLDNEPQIVTGGADEDESFEDLHERWRLHRVGDPETHRKPCGRERDSSAAPGAEDKAV